MIVCPEKLIGWITACNVGNLVNYIIKLIVMNDCFDLWLKRDQRPLPIISATAKAEHQSYTRFR